MKKVLVICALVIVMFNLSSCSVDPVIETYEIEGTVGENGSSEEEPED